MKRVISITEVVHSAEDWRGAWELCASAEAGYDEVESVLLVELACQVRPVESKPAADIAAPDWLPRPQTVREKIPVHEAAEVAKDIFQRWVRRVRQSIPSPARH